MADCNVCCGVVMATYRLKTKDGSQIYACAKCYEAFKDMAPPERKAPKE